MDGAPVDPKAIPLSGDDGDHVIEIVLGREDRAAGRRRLAAK